MESWLCAKTRKSYLGTAKEKKEKREEREAQYPMDIKEWIIETQRE